MSDTNVDVEQPRPPAQWIKSPHGVCEVYANEVHLMWSLDDVRIRVGQLINSPETPNPGKNFLAAVEERAAITFSWRAAKAIRDKLTSAIENYEKTNGEIDLNVKLPPATP